MSWSGDKGPTGPPGATSVQGATGPPMEPQDATGPQGATGVQGTMGPPMEPQKLSQIAQHFRETLGAYEAYRRLGYQPEAIFFMVAPVISPTAPANTFNLFMVLQSGGKRFNCLTAQGITGPASKLEADWQLAANAWNEGPEAERIEIWETSQLRKDSTGFIMALHQHGFTDHLGRLLN